MAKISLVHISDLHIHDGNDRTLQYLALLPAALSTEITSSDQIVVVVSGDLAFSGSAKEYAELTTAFDSLATQLQKYSSSRISWVLTPGNHDGSFKNSSRNRLNNIAAILRDGEAGIDESVIAACVEPQLPYFKFEEQYTPPGEHVFKDKLVAIHQLKVADKVLTFWALNASWMSRVPEIQGDLVFPVERYAEKTQMPSDFRFAVIHHPLNWYAQSAYHPLRELLTKNFCAVFSGHEHVSNSFWQKPVGDERGCYFLEAGALGPHDKKEVPQFSLFLMNTETGSMEQKQFAFAESPDRFVRNGVQKVYEIHLVSAGAYEVTRATRENLEEMGAPFAHPARDELSLSDVYIEPQFKGLVVDDGQPEHMLSSEIYSRLPDLGRVLIRGDEHFGKSSFLNRIFFRVVNAGCVPVRLTAREVSTGSEDQRDRLVNMRVAEQFGARALAPFEACDRSARIALIDDLDKLATHVPSYERALEYIEKKFGHSILTVSDRFDVSLLGSADVAARLSQYDEFRMLGFSYAMRAELIHRWYAMDTSLDRNQLEAKIHDASSQIDYAVSKALLPSTAFNTLMILNALQATERSQIVDAGVAQHYDMLMRRRLADSKAAAKTIDGIYAFLAHLAWHMRQTNSASLDRTEFGQFVKAFSANIHPVDGGELLALLTHARILGQSDGSVQFKHPSGRYFFLAHYIAEHADSDENVKNHALAACRRLYRKDNANLVVFLASKVSSRWIIREVASVLTSLLREVVEFDISEHSKTLNNWVSKTARLAVEDGNHDERRKERSEQKEEAQAIEEAQPEPQEVEDISKLDLFTQITLVFKTSEILGLILKSKFGSLDAGTKNDLLGHLFDGPLRAINFFLTAVNDQPDAVVEYLSRNWEDRLPGLTPDQRAKLAQKFLYFAMGAYSQGLLQRQGEIVGSPDLAAYVANVVTASQSDETPASRGRSLTYRLVGIATRLSYPGEIPANEIERLAKDLNTNPFGFTLLQGLVANHFYMFPVSIALKQKLAQAVKLDLRTQVARETMTRDAKTLPGREFKNRNASTLLARMQRSFLLQNKLVEEIQKRTRGKTGST